MALLFDRAQFLSLAIEEYSEYEISLPAFSHLILKYYWRQKSLNHLLKIKTGSYKV